MRNKVGLQFEGWQEMLANLDKLGGSDAMKKGVEAGLTASKEAVNEKLEKLLKEQFAGTRSLLNRRNQEVH